MPYAGVNPKPSVHHEGDLIPCSFLLQVASAVYRVFFESVEQLMLRPVEEEQHNTVHAVEQPVASS